MNAYMKLTLLALLVVAAEVLGFAEPAPLVIGPGETYVVGDTGATQGGNPARVYDLREGATLVMTNTAAGSGAFWSAIYNTNGLATVDCSQLAPSKAPSLGRGLRQGGNGALRIKTHSSYVRTSSDTERAVWDARDVQLLNADGSPKTNGGTIRFEGTVALIHAPTNCQSTFIKNTAPQPLVYLLGEGPAFAGPTVAVGNNVNLVVCNETKIGPDQTVSVAAGGTLTLHSVNYTLSGGELHRNAYLLTEEGERAYSAAFPIVLEDETSTLVFRENLNLTFGGEVSGRGTVTAHGGSTLTLASGARLCTYAAADDTVKLTVGSGASVRIAKGSERVVLENAGGTVLMGSKSWQEKVDVWFDMSKTNTLIRPGVGTDWEPTWSVKCFGNNPKTPYVDQVVDWRDPNAKWKLYLTANYGNKSFTEGVVPYLETRADGLSFLSALGQGGNCRIPFYDSVAKVEKSIEAKLVVMACRPAGGGGLVATETGAFGRGGKGISRPVATSDGHDVWLDGTKIVPSETKYDSDRWFVASLDVTGEKVGILGCADTSRNYCGNWAYGEVIVFINDVSEADRIAAEAYLAKKWGIATYVEKDASVERMNVCTNEVSLYGTGSVVVSNGTVKTYGQYAGSIELSDGRVIAGEPPPTAEDVPTDNLAFWFDPEDLRNATVFTDELGNTRLQYVPDHRDDDFTDQHRFLWGASGRQPWINRRAPDGCPERNWVDFSEPLDPAKDASGNNLRLINYTDGMSLAKMDSTTPVAVVPVRTGFVITDSSRGGGSPVLSAVGGSSDRIRLRGDTAAGAYDVPATAPIWSRDTTALLKNGSVWLNGIAADYKNGFTGGPELLAFQPSGGSAELGVLAYYGTGEKNATKPNGRNGTSFEYVGEVMLYTETLDAAGLGVVEAYLMNKWLGKAMPDYADLTGITVSGIGEIVVDRLGRMPQLGDDFAGRVTVTDPSGCDLRMTIDPETDTVDGALVLPEGVVAHLPEGSSITVSFASRPSRLVDRSWRLVTASGFAASVNWNLSFEGKVPRGARYVTDDRGVRLDLPSVGMLFIVR